MEFEAMVQWLIPTQPGLRQLQMLKIMHSFAVCLQCTVTLITEEVSSSIDFKTKDKQNTFFVFRLFDNFHILQIYAWQAYCMRVDYRSHGWTSLHVSPYHATEQRIPIDHQDYNHYTVFKDKTQNYWHQCGTVHAPAACYHSYLDPALVKHWYNECSKVTVQVFAGCA